MKILITGKPGIGKSTLLKQAYEYNTNSSIGIFTEEIVENNTRIGFKIKIGNNKGIFMHKYKINSKISIGNKYFVDIKIIDKFTRILINQINLKKDYLIFIDEIGLAQMQSSYFRKNIIDIFNQDRNIIATIVQKDLDWKSFFLKKNNTIYITIDSFNRKLIQKILCVIVQNMKYYEQLNLNQKKYLIDSANNYLINHNYQLAFKLFNNSLLYFIKKGITSFENYYQVTGNHKTHKVFKRNHKYICDCDLFIEQSICSHIETINLLLIK